MRPRFRLRTLWEECNWTEQWNQKKRQREQKKGDSIEMMVVEEGGKGTSENTTFESRKVHVTQRKTTDFQSEKRK